MTTKEIINLDYREEKNKKVIQRVLRQLKPLSKYSDEDIPFNAIEKAIVVMCKKYTMKVNSLALDMLANDEHIIWKVWLINDTNLKTIDIIYGITLYEVFAKTAIRLYAEIKKGINIRN